MPYKFTSKDKAFCLFSNDYAKYSGFRFQVSGLGFCSYIFRKYAHTIKQEGDKRQGDDKWRQQPNHNID